ncbi:MAG: hypothetical protein HN576_09860 [Bacteriovoracaceae bacterium]|jgi:D-glycero-alpha-D-manno-heptose-7-phosphate kinase|nr:hypothetical protein [Bacteriovoracaceae bacterium]
MNKEQQILTDHILSDELSRDGNPFPQFIIDNQKRLSQVFLDENHSMDFSKLSAMEVILYFIDTEIYIYPFIDENKTLIQLFKKPEFLNIEQQLEITASSPTKIGLAGGGSDFTDYFEEGKQGHVINCAINLYSTCKLITREDKSISITTINDAEKIEAKSLSELINHKQIGLIATILNFLSPHFGFNLNLSTDFPIGSGLGGSSSITLSILSAFNELLVEKWNKMELVQMAFLCERILFDNSGGWQDQYAIALGGIHEIKFNRNQHLLNKIPLSKDIIRGLEDRLVVCYTNISRNSGQVIDSQRKSLHSNNYLLESITESMSLVDKIKNELINNDFENLSKSLCESGKIKQSFSSHTHSSQLMEIFNQAINHGVIAGKILGAGSGGHFLFMVNKEDKKSIIEKLNISGYPSQAIKIDNGGIIVDAVIVTK